MPKPRAVTLPAIAGSSRLDHVCPVTGCSNRFQQWMLCRHPECPGAAELLAPPKKEEP